MNQPSGTEPINATFTGDSYDTPVERHRHHDGHRTHDAHRQLDHGYYNSPTPVSGVLTDANTGLTVSGEPVVFTVGTNLHGDDRLDRHRLVHHHAHRGRRAATPSRAASRGCGPTGAPDREHEYGHLHGDPGQHEHHLHRADLHHQRPAHHPVGQPDDQRHAAVRPAGDAHPRPGGSAQTCSGTTASNGNVSCTVSAVNQPVGPTPVTATYAGNTYYASSNVTGSVQVGPIQVSTTLTVAPVTGTYGSPVTRRHPGQQLHQHPGPGRDGDPQGERHPVLYGARPTPRASPPARSPRPSRPGPTP